MNKSLSPRLAQINQCFPILDRIINGYRIALEESILELSNISKEISEDISEYAIVSTSLAGKIESSVTSMLTNYAIEAANILSSEEGGEDLERLRVKRLQVGNGGIFTRHKQVIQLPL